MHDVSREAATAAAGPGSGASQALAGGGQLLLEGTVKTYRYVDDEEAAAAQAAAKPVKKGAPPAKKPAAPQPKKGEG
jgi:type IV pilus assembly protein PilO